MDRWLWDVCRGGIKMLVEDLIRALPVGQQVYILNAGENVYCGIAYLVPQHLFNYEVKTIWTYQEDDCIYFSIY